MVHRDSFPKNESWTALGAPRDSTMAFPNSSTNVAPIKTEHLPRWSPAQRVAAASTSAFHSIAGRSVTGFAFSTRVLVATYT